MSTKTVPFSARISVEDAEFISSLEYDGAHTPSDKLRALLAETRRRHQGFSDYGQNLAQMQEWLGQIKRQLLVRQQQLSQHSELLVRVLDAVTDPLMGALADRTHSRFGKFRPYLLWMALPI